MNRYTLKIVPLKSMRLLKSFRLVHHLLKRFPNFSSINLSFSTNLVEIPKSEKTQNRKWLDFNSRTVSSEIYRCNSKITILGRCRKVKEARELFDEMRQRDVVTYAAMINVYLKNGDLPKAEKLFFDMPKRNVVVESAMIDGYAKIGRIDEARRVFDEMPERNVFSWTSLVSGYLRMGWVEEGRQLFDRMPVKNNVTWTTMVSGYARNGLILEARELFDIMPEKNVVSWTAMIKAYVENDRIDEAQKLFHKMPQRNLYSWNIMISAYLEKGLVSEAIKLFELMPQRNAISWTTMVTGLARNGSIEKAREFFDHMPKKDIAAWNAMITAYAEDERMVEAFELFNYMPEKNITTWNALIDGYVKCGFSNEALKHLVLMLHTSDRPNETTFTSILTACESAVEVMQLHVLIISLGFDSDTLLTNALINIYSRTGDMGSACLAFKKLVAKDAVSWTTMILAYSNHGCGGHALQVFACMLRAGAEPDEITFVGVLSACSHTGFLQKGQRLFSSMRHAYGIVPKAEHYSCLVDLLGRAGHIEEAEKVVNQMPTNERDGAVLGALLAACNLHGCHEVASRVAEDLIKTNPSGSGAYILLANIYAARGKWDDVACVRKMMKEKKVKKVPGFSQIEVKNKNHVFFVGDREHPEMKKIYAMLEGELLPQMKDLGYSERMPPSFYNW